MALTDSLVSYWKLDESSGNASDSVGSNTLTNNNTATYGAGKINNGVDLEAGSSQYLSIADASQTGLDFTGDFSLAGWLKFESTPTSGNNYAIFAKRDSMARSYMTIIDNVGGVLKLALYTGDGGGTNEESVTVDWTPSTATWYYYVVTFTSSDKSTRFYIDGSQQGTTQTLTRSPGNGSAPYAVGSFKSGGTHGFFFDGMIDEHGAWSRVLTSTEVTELYNAGAGLQYPFGGGGGAANHFLLMGV